MCTEDGPGFGYNYSNVKRDILPELVEIIQAEIPVVLFR